MDERAALEAERSVLKGPRARRGARSPRSAAPLFVTVLLGVLIVGAPLACGAVHRTTSFIAVACSAMLAAASIWLAVDQRPRMATAIALAFPLFFLVISVAQMVPLPASFRAALDPKGSALLSLAGLDGRQPLSLDPPQTWREFAKASVGLSVALAGFLLANGRRMRFAVPGLIGGTGLAVLVVGIGHRILDEDKIFGLFKTGGGLLVGPFVNPNHTAEFLEIAAFAALAFAFSRSSRDGRLIWKIASAALAAGAISTLSRGSVLALGAGTMTWFLLTPGSVDGEPRRRSRGVAVLLGLLVVFGFALAFGGDRIIGEFRGGPGGGLSKFALSRDALHILAAHPAGIGLGSFGRVYPIYQTLPRTSWFEFVEDQPVALLIETGVAGALFLLLLWIWASWRFYKDGRHDEIEAAMVAGLVAVLAHNVVDFGLETLGVLLPFCALLGSVSGRQSIAAERSTVGHRMPLALGVLTAASSAAAMILLRSPAARDFDTMLRARPTASSLSIAQTASIAHPTDYVYALAVARLEPRTNSESVRARLRVLNRAMLLCPHCVEPHEEAARELWRLGRRQQSLLEWKAVIVESQAALIPVLDELVRAGCEPTELATLADETSRFAVTRYLLGHGWPDVARATLEQSDQRGLEFQLVRAQIDLANKDVPAARAASHRAIEIAPHDPGTVMLAADIAALEGNSDDKVLAILQDGLRFSPDNIELGRRVLALLMRSDKWQMTDEALASLRSALATAGLPTLEVNLSAAEVFERRGQFRRAMSEYDAALAHDPTNMALRLAFARAAERAGAISSAVDAYNAVLRRSPSNNEAKTALARIQLDKKMIEVNTISPPHTREEAR